jgi:hypothetical protein
MRAFIERHKGNIQQWASSLTTGWDSSWTSELPTTIDEANEKLGPYKKRGCDITTDGKGARTYWQPPIGDDKNDFSKDVLDEKALDCVPWHLAQAFCMSEGGRLPNPDEVEAIMSNDFTTDYPWQFQDTSPYDEQVQDDRVVHRNSYYTPNPPKDMRIDADYDGPLDRSFWIAPPGRRPSGANKIGVQDAVGDMLLWVNSEPRRFAWTMSWEEHSKETGNDLTDLWPTGDGSPASKENEQDGYYAIGIRCVYDQ